MERLREEVQRSWRYHRPLSLFMADLDHFKGVNDTLGHQQGNLLLQHVATILLSHVRNTDVVARYGGEEFAVILPETTGRTAVLVAEKVRAAILANPAPGFLPVTISIGVGQHQASDPDGNALIHAADAALYTAKLAGRNRVAVPSAPDLVV